MLPVWAKARLKKVEVGGKTIRIIRPPASVVHPGTGPLLKQGR